MGAVSVFTPGNYTRQPVAVYLFVKSMNLPFMSEFKSDFLKDVSSAKMSHSFVAVEVPMKHTFFGASSFLYMLMGSQGCSIFFLELLME